MRRLLSLALALGCALPLAADEQKVPLDKLPNPVRAAAEKHFPGGKLREASTEKENGKVVYEVALTFKGANHDATFDADGHLLGVEKEIAAADLPKAVTAAVTAKYPGSTVKKAEELSKGDGKPTGFEVLLTTAQGKAVEVKLDSSGKIVAEENK
jgi:uncharacterized membrane protein YkoI